MPLHIGFLMRSFPEISETFILRQITGLMDRGHRVTILSQRRPPAGPVHEEVHRYRLYERTRYLDGPRVGGSSRWRRAAHDLMGLAKLFRSPASAVDALWKGAPLSRRTTARRWKEHREVSRAGPFDVLHCHYGDLALRYAFLARALRVPFIVSFYGWDCSSFPREREAGVYDPLWVRADAVTALSRAMRRRLETLGCPARLAQVQRIGVDPEVFSFRERLPRPTGEPVQLLTVARLVEKKGIEIGLRAVAALGRSSPALSYRIIGEGPLRAELEGLSRSLGLGERVQFCGGATELAVREAMDRADLFLLPSLTAADGDQEGTPTVLMEAASCGLPVLSTHHSGIPEVVLNGETGVLVPEGDVAALAEGLRDLLARPKEWAALGRAGRRHVEAHFDVRKLSESLEEIYLAAGNASAGRVGRTSR